MIFTCNITSNIIAFHSNPVNIDSMDPEMKFIRFTKGNKQLEEVFINIKSDASMMKYNNISVVVTKNEAKKHYAQLCNNNDLFSYYGVLHNNVIIGYISLYQGDSDDCVSFAFFVSKAHQGKKFGTRIAQLIIDFYKRNKKIMGTTRIQALVSVKNIPSNKIMTKVGFTRVKTNIYSRGMLSNKYEIIMD